MEDVIKVGFRVDSLVDKDVDIEVERTSGVVNTNCVVIISLGVDCVLVDATI